MSAPVAIRIDLSSSVPAYRQIADAIRARLVEGEPPPGALLPTVRDLAVDLGVHHNTVAEAYRTLAAEGWLELTRRRGATVLHREPQRAPPEVEARYRDRLRALMAEARAAGVPLASLRAELTELIPESGVTP